MPAQNAQRRWKPPRERINPVTISLRFDDDDGADAAAGFAFDGYLRSYRAGEVREALSELADLHHWVSYLLTATASEAKEYAGLTWEQIGEATGTTGQAAWQKWRHFAGTRDPIGAISRRARQERARTAEPQPSTQHADGARRRG
jgi:hypothetical protein